MSGPLVESFRVATTLAAWRIVAISTTTANTVVYPPTNQDLPIGVTVDTVRDTVASIPVQMNGLPRVFFNDTVTVGGLVSSDTNGRGIPFTLANTTTALTLASAYIGLLVGKAVAATGTIAKVAFHPGFDRE